MNRRAAEPQQRLKRLDDPALKERTAGIKVVRDQSGVDADRVQAMPESTGERAITPKMVQRLS